MIRPFHCEWTKLMRLRQMLAVWGVMVAMLGLFALLFFGTAGDEPTPPGPGQRGSFLTLADLAQPGGLTITLQVGAQLLAIVAFVLAAGSMAGEFSQGTLKVLLARDPVRLRVLAGKTAALLLFAVAGICLAAVAQAAVATIAAGVRGIDTSAWWTGSNLADAGALLLRSLAAAGVWGLLGVLLAVLLRSAPAAIGIGIAYTLVAEPILGLVLGNIEPNVHPYLPGQVLDAFVNAGQASVGQPAGDPLSLEVASAFLVAYAALFAGVAGIVFARRDVTT